MKSFLGSQEVKEKYLARVAEHRERDELVHGTYWSFGKGCAVGCTVENSDDPHSRYPVELGIPVWLAYLEDGFFESMDNGEAKAWPTRFLEAIPVGVDLEPVKPKFLRWLMTDKVHGVVQCAKGYPNVKAAILQTDAYLEDWIRNGKPDEKKRRAAESAARSAARSAEWSAARSAARSAAESAAWSAESHHLLDLLRDAK